MANAAAEYGDPDVFYRTYYQQVLRTGVVGQAQDRTHTALERRAPADSHFSSVLEVGAGTGEHFSFVRHGFDSYLETDIRASETRQGGPDPRRSFQVANAEQLPFEDEQFDRLIATCLLLHLPNPEDALRDWRRVTRPKALLSLLVPCDPGAFVRATRQVLTVPAVRRSGFQGYKLFNARDHRNHVGAVDRLIRYTYRADSVETFRYPFRVPSWNLNAFFVYNITRSDVTARSLR